MPKFPLSVLDKETIKFAVVGAAGFLLDSSVLVLLVHAGRWSPLAARIVSMSIAVLCTWLAHRSWTFPAGRVRSRLSQIVIYVIIQFIGLLINYGVFSALILASALWREFPVLAVAAGDLTAAGLTYLLSKTIAFAEPKEAIRRKKRIAQR